MNSMVKGISVALLMGDRKRLTTEEIKMCMEMFGVSRGQVYRYEAKVDEARFYMKDLLKK